MCLAELIAGTTSAAYLGDILKMADVLTGSAILRMADIITDSAESSLVKKVETGRSGMAKAGNGSSGEENE